MTLNVAKPARPCAACVRGRIERVNRALKPIDIVAEYTSNPYNVSLAIIIFLLVAALVMLA